MFSPKITSTDKFLDMPVSSRELYFQLGMNADDDGFVTPKKIMRMIGCTEDDLRVLITKGFVIPFESGVIVITSWCVNNLVRKDWYQETIYKDEKKLLSLDENNEYKLVNDSLTKNDVFVNENVPNSLTFRQHRLGKVSLGKDIKEKTSKKEKFDFSQFHFLENDEFKKTFDYFLEMRKKIRKPATERAQELILKKLHQEQLYTAIEMLEQSITNSWQDVFALRTKIGDNNNANQQVNKFKAGSIQAAEYYNEQILRYARANGEIEGK